MADVADLIMRASVPGGEQAVQTLDKLDAGASRAEKSTSRLAREMAVADKVLRQQGQAMAGLAASIDGTLQKMHAYTLAQAEAARAAEELARKQREAAEAARKAAAEQAEIARAAAALRAQINPLGAAIERVNQELREADALYQKGAISAQELAQANAMLGAKLNALQDPHANVAASMKKATMAGVGLSRQFADIGVTAAMGMNPLMILIQQGPQLADQMSMMRAEGVGMGEAFKAMGASMGGVLRMLAPIGIAAVGLAAAFALFEREVDKSTKGATTWGQTFQATINVVGKMIKDGPIGDALKWLAGFFGATFDAISDGVLWFVDKMVGHFGAAFTLIVKNWQRLPEVFGVIAQGAANITIQAVEGLVNKVIEGLNYILKKAGKEAIGFIDLPEIKLANAKIAADYKALATSIEGNFRKGREGLFAKIIAETERLAAAQKKGAKAAKENAAAQDEVAKAIEKELQEIGAYIHAIERAGIDPETLKIMEAQTKAAVAMSNGWHDAAATILEYAHALQLTKDQQKAFTGELKTLPKEFGKVSDAVDDLINDFLGMRRQWDDVFYSIRDRDWVSAFAGLRNALKDVQAAFSKTGTMADKVGAISALGDAAGNAIGGRTGKAISSAAGAGQTAFMLTGNPYIAAAAAAVAGLAKLLGPKPTNAGAGYDLRTGAISGDKRTSDTEQAARSAGGAIIAIQDALKAAGIGLTDAVTGLVIGTRDQTQIYLQSGQTLRSAVGDSGAAVDTAMRALLTSATYVSDAQKALVESALAAGKGFDAIAEILAKYEAAQGIAKSLDDEILRLTDAKAYDLKAVRDAIEEQRKAAQQLAADGYLTADQLAVITTKLATLEGLQLDEVLKRYGQAVNDAAQATQASIDAATGATESARSALVEAYNREADALRETIDRFTELADSMKDFKAELTSGSLAGLNPFAQYRASSQAFTSARAALAANPGDAAAYGALQTASRQFLDASKAIAPNSAMYDRDLAAVRAATEQAETYARAQVGTAEAQLAQLTATVGQLVQLNAGVVTVAQAIANLQNALIVERQLGATPTANDNFDVNRYLANGPDLAQNWMEGGILRQYGATLQEAATAHYRLQGIGEIAAGIRKYADGGDHPGGLRLVGERGPELEVTGPARYFSAEDTQAMLGGGGDNADVVAELRQVRAELAEVRRSSDRTALELQKMAGNGLYVRGRAPDDPVTTEAA